MKLFFCNLQIVIIIKFLINILVRFKMRKSLNLVSAVIVYALVAVGCEENNPSKINEQTTLQSGETLAGTKWKLVGFYDTETKTFKEAEPTDCESCYRLEFDTDSTVTGFTYGNIADGEYEINYFSKNIKFIRFGSITFVAELFDSKLYVDAMNKVNSFSFTETELKLFYNDKNNYLLFERRQ